MEEFYNQAVKTADQRVIDCWKGAVTYAAERGRPLSEVQCYLKVKPSEAAIQALETDQIKLKVIHEPSQFEKGSDTPPYTQDSWSQEAFIIQIKK